MPQDELKDILSKAADNARDVSIENFYNIFYKKQY